MFDFAPFEPAFLNSHSQKSATYIRSFFIERIELITNNVPLSWGRIEANSQARIDLNDRAKVRMKGTSRLRGSCNQLE
jgi:hypothetical protein